MAVQNFKLVSEFQTIHRRPFELADPSILNPNNANPLLDGEFLVHTAAYKMARGTGPATGEVVPSFAYFAERGRYEVQAIQKGPFLYLGDYEADTLIMDATGVTLGMALVAAEVTIATLAKRGLVRWPAVPVGGEKVVGYVTRLPANNKGFLRFIRVS
jgi:hypothetical protein